MKQNHPSHLPFSSALQVMNRIEALFLDERLWLCCKSYTDSQTKHSVFDCSPCFSAQRFPFSLQDFSPKKLSQPPLDAKCNRSVWVPLKQIWLHQREDLSLSIEGSLCKQT